MSPGQTQMENVESHKNTLYLENIGVEYELYLKNADDFNGTYTNLYDTYYIRIS